MDGQATMQAKGFQEEQAAYGTDEMQSLIGQVRRWGPAGPAYQVLKIDGDGNAVCEVIYSGEMVTCPASELLQDPIAETLP